VLVKRRGCAGFVILQASKMHDFWGVFWGGGILRNPAESVVFWWEKVYKKNQGF
jgi:hypothetical protein